MFTHRRRILVIANETVEGDVLHETIRFNASEAREVEVLVIAPALNSRVRHWISDEGEARRRAELRLATCVDRLAAAGIEATGWVGDADPLQAIQDGLHFFAADVIIIATHPEGRSHWLARNVVGRARLRFPQEIRHVVVGAGAGQEVVAA
jgi:hypothetical protein